jgi:hypothetical protein
LAEEIDVHPIICGILFWAAAAQQSPTATLQVQVVPEARVDPSHLILHFEVPGDSEGPPSQTVTVSARVRAAPGRLIHLTATQIGTLPVRWTGTAISASGGGRQAECVGGTFAARNPQNLVEGWEKSGTLTCTFTFFLAGSLPPGSYTTTLHLEAQ